MGHGWKGWPVAVEGVCEYAVCVQLTRGDTAALGLELQAHHHWWEYVFGTG